VGAGAGAGAATAGASSSTSISMNFCTLVRNLSNPVRTSSTIATASNSAIACCSSRRGGFS